MSAEWAAAGALGAVTVLGLAGANQLRDRGFVCDVGYRTIKSRSVGAGGGLEVSELLGLAVGDGDFCACFKEGQADRSAQATRAAGDEDRLIDERHRQNCRTLRDRKKEPRRRG